MKKCPNCNFEVSDTAKFCRSCGFNIKKYEEENQGGTMFCDECGAKIPFGSAFCEECGFKLENVEATASSGGLDFGALGGLSTVATEQLYEQNGLKVENGVLVKYTGKKRNVTIPGTIEEIFDKAFENNELVTSVKIEEGVQVIGKRAFASCPSLVEINIPSSCKKLYEDTFENDNLEHITFAERNDDVIFSLISENIKNYLNKDEINEFIKEKNGKVLVNIKGMADFALEKQKEEEIKNTYEIENGVLVKCKIDLAKAKIPNGVVKIGNEAFRDCTNLAVVEIPDSVASIGNNAFFGCTSLAKINLPNSVTTIGRVAFYNCTNLTSIEIPSSVTTIGGSAFQGCTNLTSIEIPNGVTTIGGSAFQCCTNLTSIEIPNSVTTIGYNAFRDCKNLKSIKLSRYCKCETNWNYNCPARVTYID